MLVLNMIPVDAVPSLSVLAQTWVSEQVNAGLYKIMQEPLLTLEVAYQAC